MILTERIVTKMSRRFALFLMKELGPLNKKPKLMILKAISTLNKIVVVMSIKFSVLLN